jgi:hypothetical protein
VPPYTPGDGKDSCNNNSDNGEEVLTFLLIRHHKRSLTTFFGWQNHQIETMSSALTNLVPILDGSNYQQWAPPMRNFLKSQGQWLILTEDNPADWYLAPVEELPFSTTADDDADEEATATETKTKAKAKASTSISTKVTDEQKDEMREWAETNSKAVGNISLRLHHSIQYKYQDEDNAGKCHD